MDLHSMGKNLKGTWQPMASSGKRSHHYGLKVMIYETNWETLENSRNRKKELEARTAKVSTTIPFHTTPNNKSGSPSELLFKGKIRRYLPELTLKKVINKHKLAKTNLEKKKEENKEYYDRSRRAKEADIRTEDTAICKQEKKNKLTSKFDPKHYTVVQLKYNMVTVKRDDGKTMTRNVSFLKKVFMDKSEDEPKQEPIFKKINKD